MSDASSQSPNQHVFISHASTDDDFVRELRVKLELSGVKLWVDSRNLHGGNKLEPEIQQAILDSSHVLVVLSPRTINSPWVHKEIRFAEANDHDVIPLMLPGIEPSALSMWFDEEPVGLKVELSPGKLNEAMSGILAALGQRLPDDPVIDIEVEQQPVVELLLSLSEPTLVHDEDDVEQLSARAELTYIPANLHEREVKSRAFRFVAPIGKKEQKDLSWYLEEYYRWPVGEFKRRAKQTEDDFPNWGRALFDAVLGLDVCQEPMFAWNSVRVSSPSPQLLSPKERGFERRLSVEVDASFLDENSEVEANAKAAASRLQTLPWELLFDDGAYLSDGAHPVRIRRRLPNFKHQSPSITQLPIRILLLSPRPEEKNIAYIDHRASALPLVQAVETLGDMVQLTVLSPPTLGALETELHRARDAGASYHVLHFDGHGVYDRQHGLGALCFERPQDVGKLTARRNELVYANKLGALTRDFRIPLVFLEACQTAQAEYDPSASVAAKLLEEGVTSVVAMSHSVLVETARRFVTAFYQAIAKGQRVGTAMLAGQKALMRDTYRLPVPGAGDLHLQDWFVPVLYQEQNDPVLFNRLPSEQAKRMMAQQRQAVLGALPETPQHTFIGRSRELLALERLLEREPYAVIRGQGGIGKTTVAVELASWLVRSRRFDRCAFVCVEDYSHDRAVLDVLGRQLVGDFYSVAEYGDDLDEALLPLLRALENYRCLIVVDNLETLLGDEVSDNLGGVFELLQKFLMPSSKASDSGASLIFTTREPLPKPFDHNEIMLVALDHTDAKALVLQIMNNQGLVLQHDDKGNDPEEVDALVDVVGGHARALVLLARELAIKGVMATTENVRAVMIDLERRHPGERELSLFASVELSLQRLSPEVRGQIDGLAVFCDGGYTFHHVLGVDDEKNSQILTELVHVGLANPVGTYGYIRLDPALPFYLTLNLDQESLTLYRNRWMDMMGALIDFLNSQFFKDYKLCKYLVNYELPNFMAYMRRLLGAVSNNEIPRNFFLEKISVLEQILIRTDSRQAMLTVMNWHRDIAALGDDWSHNKFTQQRVGIDHLLEQGLFKDAISEARSLFKKCQSEGADAYDGADYDVMGAYYYLGNTLRCGGYPKEALWYLNKAVDLAESRKADVASLMFTALGDCYRDIDHHVEAIKFYRKSISLCRDLGNVRGELVSEMQLATVFLDIENYKEALTIYDRNRNMIESLGESQMLSRLFYQSGKAYHALGSYDEAEKLYRKSLIIDTKTNHWFGAGSCFGFLSKLYLDMGKLDGAINFARQAVFYLERSGHDDRMKRAIANLIKILLESQRLNDARSEIDELAKQKKVFDSWDIWHFYQILEEAEGDKVKASQARMKAINEYLLYRRGGGESHEGDAWLCGLTLRAIRENDYNEIRQNLGHLASSENWQEPKDKAFLDSLTAILDGERDLAIADDERLIYQNAAELILLLGELKN